MKLGTCFAAGTHAVLNVNHRIGLSQSLESLDELLNVVVGGLVVLGHGELSWGVGGLVRLDDSWSWIGRLWHQALPGDGGLSKGTGRLSWSAGEENLGHLAELGVTDSTALGHTGGTEEHSADHYDCLVECRKE